MTTLTEESIAKAHAIAQGHEVEFQNPFGVVYLRAHYNAADHVLRSVWTGFVSPEDIVLSSKVKLVAMAEVKMVAIINDNQTVEGPWYDANNWIEHEWLPKATALGLRKLAMVLSPDAYAALSAVEMAERIAKHQEYELVTGLFPNMQEAEAWVAKDSD